MRTKTSYKDADAHNSFSPEAPAINAVSRHLIRFSPDPTLTAEALAERASYQPRQPIKPTIDTSGVPWDEVMSRLQKVCRTIAVTRGGRVRTRSSSAEDELLQLMTEYNLMGDNTILQAETLRPAPSHLANMRMTLAFFDNEDARGHDPRGHDVRRKW